MTYSWEEYIPPFYIPLYINQDIPIIEPNYLGSASGTMDTGVR